MESTPRLYETLVDVLRPHPNWVDLRHLKTLTWRVVGLMHAGTISLTAWAPDVHSRATYAQSTVRRFARGLEPDRIDVHALYGPLIQQALAEWGTQVLYLALDPSTLWNTDGLVRISLVDRGRAVPLVWKVLDQPSSRVAYNVYNDGLDEVVEWLPFRCHVVFSADRGFADTHLMDHLARLGWHWRIRIQGSCWIYRDGKRCCNGNRLALSPGQALCWHPVYITKQGDGPVHLALGRPQDSKDYWFVVSDAPTEPQTCEAYGWRCDIDEHFLEDQSHGFQ
jgi:hypothetical protein